MKLFNELSETIEKFLITSETENPNFFVESKECSPLFTLSGSVIFI